MPGLVSQPMTQKSKNLLQIPKSLQLTNQTLKHTELATRKGTHVLQCSCINATESKNPRELYKKIDEKIPNNKNKNPNKKWIDMPLPSKPRWSHCSGFPNVEPLLMIIKRKVSYATSFRVAKTSLGINRKIRASTSRNDHQLNANSRIYKMKFKRIWYNPFAFMNN